MTSRTRTQGFGSTEIIVIIVVVVIVGALGYLAFTRFTAPHDDTATQTTSQTDHTATANHETMNMPKVNDTNDLDKATQSLDDPSFDNDGLSDLDTQSGEF